MPGRQKRCYPFSQPPNTLPSTTQIPSLQPPKKQPSLEPPNTLPAATQHECPAEEQRCWGGGCLFVALADLEDFASDERAERDDPRQRVDPGTYRFLNSLERILRVAKPVPLPD